MGRTATMQAHDIAEAVSAAWYSNASHAVERIEIPLGVIAALCINPLKTSPSGNRALTSWFEQLDDDGMVAMLREIWDLIWILHPYQVQQAEVLLAWLAESPDTKTLYAVRRVVRAALQAGLLELVNHPDPGQRADTDVLGTLLTHMRAQGARKGQGEYHTPPEVSDLIATALADWGFDAKPPQPGNSIHDPAAGSGGLIRAAAQSLRRRGSDPADFEWVMGDINPLAVACAAANALIWGLGDNVLIYVADALAEPEAPVAAAAHRRDVLEHHRTVVSGAATAAKYLVAERALFQRHNVA